MSTTMVRVKGSTLHKLQQVKKDMGAKSYDALISDLLDTSIAVKELSEKAEEARRARCNKPISSTTVYDGRGDFYGD